MAKKGKEKESKASSDDLILTASSDSSQDNLEDISQNDVPDGTEMTDDALQMTDTDEASQVVEMLVQLLQQDPELAAKISDTIRQHYAGIGGGAPETNNINGGVSMADIGAIPNNMDFSNMGMPANTGAGVNAGAIPQGSSIPPEILDRINSIEQQQADMAVERELADTKKEYETLRQNIPTLPDLDDKEIIQIALQRNGLPLTDALYIWAMQKIKSGNPDGSTAAEKIVATTLNNSKVKNLPSVEGKGGSVPSGAAEPPGSLKDANNMAKEKLRALFGSM